MPLLVLAGLIALAAATHAPDRGSAATRSPLVRPAELLGQISRYRKATWRWQRVMSAPLTRSSFSPARHRSRVYRRWVRDLWRRRAIRARRLAANPPHESAWRCLQRHEARWNDPNPPYYGGLQMDWTFMRLYGGRLLRRKGPASNWTPLEQMWVGEKALRRGRGFYPWPNAARRCGLI